MSADNTVIILFSKDDAGKQEYRVGHVQAAENFDWFIQEKKFAKLNDWLLHYFGNAQVHSSYEEAMREAREVHGSYDYVEYGISTRNLHDIPFPPKSYANLS